MTSHTCDDVSSCSANFANFPHTPPVVALQRRIQPRAIGYSARAFITFIFQRIKRENGKQHLLFYSQGVLFYMPISCYWKCNFSVCWFVCPLVCHVGCSFGQLVGNQSVTQGVHLILCFFPKIFKYSGLWSFSVFPRCQCVYTHQAGRTPALQQNWQSSEK